MTQNWTIKTLLDWSVEFFQKKDIESARLDAELLLACILKLKRLDLYLQFDRTLTSKELTDYKILIKRRAEYEPVAYIVGEKEFWSKPFKVTPAVLIPRPETEVLVEQVLRKITLEKYRDPRGGPVKLLFPTPPVPGAARACEALRRKNSELARTTMGDIFQQTLYGLEIGLGSGIISTILLSECPNLKMHAVEISKDAITIAKENLVRHNVLDRIEIFEKDFLDLESPKEKYDFLVSNPPYVKEEEYLRLPKTVRDFEPKSAIVAGPTGPEFHQAIADRVNNFVKPGGFVAIEIGEDQGQDVTKIFEKADLKNITLIQDYSKKNRVVVALAAERVGG